jgi:serine/threonine protein kinase
MKKKLDRFVMTELLSETGAGTVYRAEEALPGGIVRPVALKTFQVLRDNDVKGRKRFFDELGILIQLGGHPNIVNVYGMGLTDNVPWIAMEWIPTVLSQAMREQPGSPDHVAEMMRQVANGLAAMHNADPQLLHNDLTPSNILVDRFGTYKLTDFGLAGPSNVDRTRVMATVKYAAPELLSREFGPLTPATDFYALGHIAYELALGGRLHRHQFPAVFDAKRAGKEGSAPMWMAWHCSPETRPAPISEVRPEFPAELSAIIDKLINKRAAERYSSADALLADLRSSAAAVAAAAQSIAAGNSGAAGAAGAGSSIRASSSAARFPSASKGPGPRPNSTSGSTAPGMPGTIGSFGVGSTGIGGGSSGGDSSGADQYSAAGAFSGGRQLAGADAALLSSGAAGSSGAPAAKASPLPLAPTGSELYYVRLGPKTGGPYDVPTLQRLIKQGQVSRLHKVSTDKINWQNITSVEGLM